MHWYSSCFAVSRELGHTMKHVSGAAAVILLLLGGSEPQAQPIPSRPHAGTHFLVEFNAGGSQLGTALGGTIGAGGKVPWLPLRCYLVAEMAYSTANQHGTLPHSSLAYRDERDYREVTAGLRLYLPVLGKLRFFFEALGGGSHVSALLARDDYASLTTAGWHGIVQLGGGVQYRLWEHLSLGARVKWSSAQDDLSELREISGAPNPSLVSFTGALTWHF